MMRADFSHQLRADDIRRDLGTRRIANAITVMSEINSTNLYALDTLAVHQGRAADGAVIFAEHQNAGRGRMGRSWHSVRGAGLAFTVLLCEDTPSPPPARLVMAAAVAVVEGIEEATDVQSVIHWPNDVYVGDKKLAGILVEMRALAGVGLCIAVGIGINCLQHRPHFPPEIRDRATSLDMESTRPVDRVAVARALLRRLDSYFCDPGGVGDEQLALDWKAHSADMGQHITLVHDGQTFVGRVVDVHAETGLLLQLDHGGRRQFDPATTARS